MEVTGDDGTLSGTYLFDGVSEAYKRFDGGITYIIGKYTDGAFYLGEGIALSHVGDYPYYYVSRQPTCASCAGSCESEQCTKGV